MCRSQKGLPECLGVRSIRFIITFWLKGGIVLMILHECHQVIKPLFMALSLAPNFPNTSILSGPLARLNDQAQALHASPLLPKGTENGWSTIKWRTNIISIQLSQFFRNEWVLAPSISAPPPTEIVVIGCHPSLCLVLLFVVMVSDAGKGGTAAGASSCTWRWGLQQELNPPFDSLGCVHLWESKGICVQTLEKFSASWVNMFPPKQISKFIHKYGNLRNRNRNHQTCVMYKMKTTTWRGNVCKGNPWRNSMSLFPWKLSNSDYLFFKVRTNFPKVVL